MSHAAVQVLQLRELFDASGTNTSPPRPRPLGRCRRVEDARHVGLDVSPAARRNSHGPLVPASAYSETPRCARRLPSTTSCPAGCSPGFPGRALSLRWHPSGSGRRPESSGSAGPPAAGTGRPLSPSIVTPSWHFPQAYLGAVFVLDEV